MGKCQCYDCQNTFPKLREIVEKHPEYKDFLNELWSRIEEAETHAILYKEKLEELKKN